MEPVLAMEEIEREEGPMRRDAIDRAKRAIKLMEKGVPVAEAIKKAGTSLGTVKKELQRQGKKARIVKTRRGQKRTVSGYHAKKAEDVARKMQYDGLSATAACRDCHTQIGTVKDVRLAGKCKLLRKYGRTYRLQVYEVNTYAAVFYGRLRNVGSPIAITSRRGLLEDPRTISKSKLPSDDYASILWQLDFDDFRSTLSSRDVCDKYLDDILPWLRAELEQKTVSKTIVSWLMKSGDQGLSKLIDAGLLTADEADEIRAGRKKYDISLLEETFRVGVIFDDELRCGVDDRSKRAVFVCRSQVKKDDPVVDDGNFQVLVFRRSGNYSYPYKPRRVRYPHSIDEDVVWKKTH